MPGSKLPSYLDGSKPGDYGFDPLGLGEVPANLERFREAELLNARWAMLGVAGCWGVEAGGFGTWQEAPLAAQQSWGGIDLPISNMSTLVGFEILLMAFAEQQRISETDVSKRMYPGGSFDPAGLSKGDGFESLKRKEIANGRLAMVAFLGILAQNQAYPDGLGPVQALLNHVADPWHVNAASNSLAVPWI
jgi:light-harvesting complex I chlorophyll a/b binding protein 1